MMNQQRPVWSVARQTDLRMFVRSMARRRVVPCPNRENPSVAKKRIAKEGEVKVDRRQTKNRRSDGDRRQDEVAVATERRSSERRKVTRRRQIDPTTCERDYSNDEIEFMHALDEYKRANGRMFPTCSEILEVVRKLGYEKRRPEDLPLVMETAPEETSAESNSVDPNE